MAANGNAGRYSLISCCPKNSMPKLLGRLALGCIRLLFIKPCSAASSDLWLSCSNIFAANLPFWVVPEQIVVAPVSVVQLEYARAVAEIFHAAGLRCIIDEANETLSRRIVAAHDKGIPIFVTVGPKEVSAGTVTIRERGGKRSVQSLSDATDWLKAINASN